MAYNDFLSQFENEIEGAGYNQPASSDDFLSQFENNQSNNFNEYYDNQQQNTNDILDSYDNGAAVEQSSEAKEEPAYSVEESAKQTNEGKSYLETAIGDVTGEQPKEDFLGLFEKPEIKTTPERDALIEEYNNLGNPNYLHTKAERDAYIQKHDELLGQLRAIDEELGNGAMDYNFRDRSQSVLGGSLKGYGADMMNAGATVLSGFNELGERLGGDTGQYAGWATDEVSRAAIPQENNPDAYAQQRQEVADMQAKSDELAQASAADLERAKNNQSKFAQFGTDIATNAIQMGMDALAAGLTGGSSLAPMFVRSAGGGAREARQDGASTAEQLTYGAVRGGIEVATEKMFDGLAKIYGAGFADDAVEKLIGKLGQGNKLVQSGLRWLFSGLGEAAEEGASGLSEPLTKMIYQGTEALKEYKDPEYWAENMYSMLVGYAMGGAGGAVNLVNGENRKANAEIQKGIDQRNEIKNNLVQNNGMSDADARRAADILARVAQGETISKKESAFLKSVQEANGGLDTSKPSTAAPQAEAQTTVPVPDSRKFVRENPTETSTTEQGEITQPTQQESVEAPSVELNSKPEAEGPTAEELEAAERAANAGEAPPKGMEKTLQDAQQKTEDAQKKAAQQPAPEPEKPLRKIKPYTENEKILAEDRARLDRQNKSLRKQVEKLSKQTKRTDVKTARESDVKKAAREIVKAYGSDVDVGETSAKMQALADYLVQHTGENIDYDEVQRMAEEIAADIVDNIYTDTTDEYSKQRAEDVKKAIKNNTVNFGQLAAQFSMEDAKAQFPGMKFAKTKGMSVQDFYDMLANNNLVEPDVVGAREQLEAIYDVLASGETKMEQTYANDANYDQAVNETANEILDTLLSDAVRESEPTFADKQAAKYDAMKSNMQQKIDAEKEARQADKKASRERLDQFRRQAAQSKKEAVAKEKAEKYKSNKRIQEQYQNMIERRENKRKTSAQRKKIKGLYNELSKAVTRPTEGKYVPKELMNAAIDLLESIDTDTGSVSSTEKLNKLRAAFNEVKNDPNYSAIVTDEVHQAMLDSLYETIGGTPLNEMTSDQLTRVYDTMKALTHEIKDGVKVKIRNEEHQASEISKQMSNESKQAKGWGKGALGAINSWYTGAFGRATTYFERLGGFVKNSAWSQMGERLNEGQRKATEEKVRAATKFSKLLTDKAEKTLRETVKLGKDASGNDIEVSRGMMLSLKMLLDSKDGARHIKYGGLTIPGISDYYKGKNDGGFGQSHSRALGISPELAQAQAEYRKIAEEYKKIDVEENKDAEWEKKIDDVVARLDAKEAEIDGIIGKGESYIDALKGEIEKQLTDYDRQWIKTAREYFDEAQVLLNDTTMDVYGFKKANVADYFPLTTDPNFRKASFDSISRDMSLENSGFMKTRVNSGNPILLLDISEVIANYSDKVANYTGIMPAIRDFQKVYGKTEAGFANSLQETLDSKFGKSASKYIEDLVADLQGARRTSNSAFGKLLSSARGNMAQAVLSMNPRVAFSQSASYMNAASEIGWQPLAKALSMGKGPMSDAKVMDLITKYSPLMYYRTLGNSNAAMTDIQGNAKWQNQMLKKFDFVMGWINAVDQRTVGRLWYASEAYVQQQGTDYAKGTDEYYEEVAKVFNRVVEKTQPNYTTMQRAGILREPNELVKSMTMFMTQRLQNQNILYEAGERLAKYEADFKNGENGVTEADVKQARKDMFNAVSSQLMSTATLVTFKGAIDALMHNMKRYRDDDDELNAKSISAKLGSDFADSLIGNFLGGTEIYSLYSALFKDARYDGITLNGISTISDTLKDIAAAKNAKPEKQLDKTWQVVEDVSKLFGIPLENAEKFVDAVWKHAQDVVNGNLGTFESDLSEGPIDKMTKVDFGYKPVDNMFSPLYNAITQTSSSKEVAKEIQRLYESTGISGVYPNIRGVNKITVDNEEYDLTGKDGEKYHQTAGRTAEEFAKNLMDSKAYKAMTDEQKAQALKTMYSYAKDIAKDEFIADHGIDAESVSTATSLLKGLDKPGEANDYTKLDEKNLADYVSYTTLLKSNINDGNYKEIDKVVGWYGGMNENMQTVLMERNTDLKRLLGYKDIGEGSETYFKMKEAIVQSQINLDQSANTSAYVRLYAIADCDLPESAKQNIVKNLMQGDDDFIGKHGKAAFNALSDRGFSVAQAAQFFDIALHCKTWKNTGEEADVNGQLRNDNTAFAIMQLPGLTESERISLYNAIRAQVSSKFNDWGNYSYQSEVKYVNKPTNKANYSTGIKISDKRNYTTSDALWQAYLSNAS